MSVEIQDESEVPIDLTFLEHTLQQALELAGCPDMEVSVLLTNDERMTELNHTYRDLDETTDVLSFPQCEPGEEDSSGLLGDIVISIPTASTQASERGTNLQSELRFLALHGLLHLLGRDHETEGWETWEQALVEITPHE
jgi:probable rRNA maturation factor